MDLVSKNTMYRLRHVARNYDLYLFILPALAYVIAYCYVPMYGAQIAFRDFRSVDGIWGSQWVGLKHFHRFLSTPSYQGLIKNTLVLSIYSLAINFPFSILFALLINELRNNGYRRFIQTLSYAPHFISTVVLVSMLSMFLREKNGLINNLLGLLGIAPLPFLSVANWFPTIYVFSGAWQDLGWSAIIYISALSGVDTTLHEAAMIDGATRLQRIVHINLPSILPTITVMLILSLGNVMSVGFEKAYLMQNALNTETSEIISTFVYKMGLQYTQYSFATAIGLFNSIVNFILLIGVNQLARRIGEYSLW